MFYTSEYKVHINVEQNRGFNAPLTTTSMYLEAFRVLLMDASVPVYRDCKIDVNFGAFVRILITENSMFLSI